MREHGVPIAIPEGMDASELDKAFRYGVHTPELKEESFIRKELADKPRSGHVSISPLAKVRHLKGLWIYPPNSNSENGE